MKVIEKKLNEIIHCNDTPAWASALINCLVIARLKDENVILEKYLSTIKQSIDYNEQKSRNICLLIFDCVVNKQLLFVFENFPGISVDVTH